MYNRTHYNRVVYNGPVIPLPTLPIIVAPIPVALTAAFDLTQLAGIDILTTAQAGQEVTALSGGLEAVPLS